MIIYIYLQENANKLMFLLGYNEMHIMKKHQYSICIPRLTHTNKKFIKNIFDKYQWGEIDNIDIIDKNGNCKAFIHYKYWEKNDKVDAVRERLANGDIINIIYDTPWFWKCSASRV